MLIYDPSNKTAFGDPVFDNGKGVTFRYLPVRFGLSKFIPYGPNLADNVDPDFAVSEISKLFGLKVKIDIPNIYDENIKTKLLKGFEKYGFKPSKYLVDDQTIIITKDTFNIEKKDRYYVRKSNENFQYVFKTTLTENEVMAIYQLYLQSAKRKGFNPKRIEVFKLHMEKSFAVLAYQNDVIKAFVVGEGTTILDKGEQYDVLYNLYTAAADDAFEKYVGYGMYDKWLTSAFDAGFRKVDMYGAKAGTAYATFKRKFVYKSEDLSTIKLPGSFIKYKLF